MQHLWRHSKFLPVHAGGDKQPEDFHYTHLWVDKAGETHLEECSMKGFDLKTYAKGACPQCVHLARPAVQSLKATRHSTPYEARCLAGEQRKLGFSTTVNHQLADSLLLKLLHKHSAMSHIRASCSP